LPDDLVIVDNQHTSERLGHGARLPGSAWQ
jgi:hypothetical protein